MVSASRQSPQDTANEKKCLCLRPSSLLAAGFLVVAAVVLAYLGGVMSGRAYWRSHAAPVAARAATAQSSAVDDDASSSGADADSQTGQAEPRQKVLAPEELRFARVLRNDSATGDAPLKPLPPMTPVQPRPVAVAQPGGAVSASDAQSQPGAQAMPAASGVVKPPSAKMYDYVFQVGAFKDGDSVDSLRQRLEGRGMRTRMERSGKLYVVLVLLRGDEARAAEVLHTTESMGLGKPIQRSRKPVQ